MECLASSFFPFVHADEQGWLARECFYWSTSRLYLSQLAGRSWRSDPYDSKWIHLLFRWLFRGLTADILRKIHRLLNESYTVPISWACLGQKHKQLMLAIGMAPTTPSTTFYQYAWLLPVPSLPWNRVKEGQSKPLWVVVWTLWRYIKIVIIT